MLKRGCITLAEANACVAAYGKIPIKRFDVELRPVLALSNQLKTYAYDAYMLVCAQQFGTPLLTLDKALKVHAESLGIELLEV